MTTLIGSRWLRPARIDLFDFMGAELRWSEVGQGILDTRCVEIPRRANAICEEGAVGAESRSPAHSVLEPATVLVRRPASIGRMCLLRFAGR